MPVAAPTFSVAPFFNGSVVHPPLERFAFGVEVSHDDLPGRSFQLIQFFKVWGGNQV